MGTVHRLRGINYAERRWESTLKHSNLSQFERKQLARKIGELRRCELPVPGDPEVGFPPLMTLTHFVHYVKGTTLRVVYDFDDSKLFLFSLHRITR